MISSAAVFGRCALNSSHWSGKSVKAIMPWVIELRVVSLPATVRVTTNIPNSASVSWPSASASISVVTMSSPGSSALRAANCMAYQINSPVEPQRVVLGELGIVVADHLVGPVEQLVAVLQRNAEQSGDRLQRQLAGDLEDEVAGALVGGLARRCAVRAR